MIDEIDSYNYYSQSLSMKNGMGNPFEKLDTDGSGSLDEKKLAAGLSGLLQAYESQTATDTSSLLSLLA